MANENLIDRGTFKAKGIPILGPSIGGMVFGNVFFVDPANGSDGNTGKNPKAAFAKLSYAHGKCVAGQNDVVYLIGNGATSGSARETETLVWSKNATHLIGLAAPTNVAARARYSSASGTTYATLYTHSADGCIISNVHMFQDYATDAANICANVTGQRNYFYNCHLAGGGNATGADNAAMSSLSLTGDGENTFEDCTIGLDTVARSAANAEIDFKSAAVRNVFKGCRIISMCDDATHLFVKADTSGDLDRFTIFDRCQFINAVASTSTTMTAAINVHATAGGMIVLDNCILIGATNWSAADSTNIWLAGVGMQASGDLLTGLAHTFDES